VADPLRPLRTAEIDFLAGLCEFARMKFPSSNQIDALVVRDLAFLAICLMMFLLASLVVKGS
jgi:hypothetical protein